VEKHIAGTNGYELKEKTKTTNPKDLPVPYIILLEDY